MKCDCSCQHFLCNDLLRIKIENTPIPIHLHPYTHTHAATRIAVAFAVVVLQRSQSRDALQPAMLEANWQKKDEGEREEKAAEAEWQSIQC